MIGNELIDEEATRTWSRITQIVRSRSVCSEGLDKSGWDCIRRAYKDIREQARSYEEPNFQGGGEAIC